MIVSNSIIIKPSRLKDQCKAPQFIPGNNQQQLVEVDLGFSSNNPEYRQEKLCIFLPDNIYYQKLVLTDGKGNAIKDDARTLVITGEITDVQNISFQTEVYPRLPQEAGISTSQILLPFYPELNTEIIIKDELFIFYHFSCSKIIYRIDKKPYLQLRYLGNYFNTNITGVLRNWHNEAITSLENIGFKQ